MAKLPLVLATNPIDPAGAAILRAHARLIVAPDTAPATLNGMAREADGIIVRTPLPPDIVDHAPGLRGIVRHGAGLDMVPVAAATARRIPVANVPGANAQAVAEYCFAATFELMRRLALADRTLRTSGWGTARSLSDSALELGGRTLGVVGVGNIGRRVAQIGRAGFGMRVLGTARRPETLPADVVPAAIEELFAQSDIIVLSCPLTDQTRGLIGPDLLRLAKATAVLVNVSRGAVIDDQALADALLDGRLGGAALDVFAVQPLPQDHAFFGLKNVLLTPHLAGLTKESMTLMSTVSAEEMVRILSGARPLNLVNPEIYA
jgi:D-3-phosphoglycerate dehydrogenase / 2-oxoglutarate reductase